MDASAKLTASNDALNRLVLMIMPHFFCQASHTQHGLTKDIIQRRAFTVCGVLPTPIGVCDIDTARMHAHADI